MKETEKDEAFVETAKYLLSERAEKIDTKTRSRLRKGRYAALQSLKSRKRPTPWMWPAAGMAVACTAVLAFFLILKEPGPQEVLSNMEDIELLASSEPIEFYDDLEFYNWLAEHEGTS